MNFIKEAQINAIGKSNGLNILSGFRMGIVKVSKEIQEDGTVNVIFTVLTYTDDTHANLVINDDIDQEST